MAWVLCLTSHLKDNYSKTSPYDHPEDATNPLLRTIFFRTDFFLHYNQHFHASVNMNWTTCTKFLGSEGTADQLSVFCLSVGFDCNMIVLIDQDVTQHKKRTCHLIF